MRRIVIAIGVSTLAAVVIAFMVTEWFEAAIKRVVIGVNRRHLGRIPKSIFFAFEASFFIAIEGRTRGPHSLIQTQACCN
jgi:hypothetical protein